MINNINKLPEVQFIKIFSNIFENSQFIAEALYKKRSDGFNNFEDLVKKMMNIFENTTKEQKLKILNAHPDLADKAKITSMTPDSKSEQNSAGLDQCTEDEFKEFKKLNDLYKKKFNFPFILAVKGKNKSEILDNFKKRISNSLDEEFSNCLNEVKLIAKLRLKEIETNIE